jgi:hypothetical protein
MAKWHPLLLVFQLLPLWGGLPGLREDPGDHTIWITAFWLSPCRPGDTALESRLEAVERYFAAVSYGRSRIRVDNQSYPGPQADTLHLQRASSAQEARRAFLRYTLSAINRSDPIRTSYALLVVNGPIWPFTDRSPLPTVPSLKAVSVISRDCDWGTIAHEVGHLLGLPDLYDHRLADRGLTAASPVGPWCLMSRSALRPGVCAWGRLYLGWILDEEVAFVEPGEERTIRLDALEAPRTSFRVAKVRLAASRYYLIEARTRVGVDLFLPAEGILITRVDYFAEQPSDRIRIIDARPDTPTMGDAAFTTQPGRNEFHDALSDIDIVVIARTGHTFSVRCRNGAKSSDQGM